MGDMGPALSVRTHPITNNNEHFLALPNCLQGLQSLFLALCPSHCHSEHDQKCHSQGPSLLLLSTIMGTHRENQPGDLQTDMDSLEWGSAPLNSRAGMDSHLPWHQGMCQPWGCSAFPITRLGSGWARLSWCPRLSTVSLSPCRLSVHGRRRLRHWECCSFVVDTRAEPQQPQLSAGTASTALLHSQNQRAFALPHHFSSEGKPKQNAVCSLLSLKTGWNGRWCMNSPPWTILSPFPPHFPCST